MPRKCQRIAISAEVERAGTKEAKSEEANSLALIEYKNTIDANIYFPLQMLYLRTCMKIEYVVSGTTGGLYGPELLL